MGNLENTTPATGGSTQAPAMDYASMPAGEKETIKKKITSHRTPLLLVGIFAYIWLNLVRSSVGMVSSGLITELGLGAAQIALFGAIFNYVYAFSNVPAGILGDTLGPRWTMTVCNAFIALGCLIFAMANDFTMICVGRAIMGFGCAAVYSNLSKALTAWTRAKDYPGLNGRVMAYSKIGSLLAATPLALLIAAVSSKTAMLLIGGVSVLITVLIGIFIHNSPHNLGLPTYDELEGTAVTKRAPAKVKMAEGLATLLRQPQVWLLILSAVGINCMSAPSDTWGPTIMVQALGFERVTAGHLISVKTYAAIVMAFFAGPIAKKFSIRTCIGLSYAFNLIGIAIYTIFLPSLTPAVFVFIFLLMGLGQTFALSSCFSLGRIMVSNTYYASLIGIINFICWGFGSGVLSNMWAIFVDDSFSVGGFQKALIFQCALCLIGCVAFLFTKEKRIEAFRELE